MKKLFSLVLILTFGLVLSACNTDNNDTCPEDSFNIGLVTDTGGIDDQSFNQGTWEGVERFVEDNDGEACSRYLQSEQDADYIPNLTTFAEENFSLIVAPGFLFIDAMTTVAENNPDQNFLLIDEVVNVENVASATFAEHEGSYLVGVAAAEQAIADGEDTVGFIGGGDFPLIHKFEVGFRKGVEDTATAAGESITVLIEYASGFDKANEGQTLANQMYDNGAYIIYHAAGGTGNGVIKEARDRALTDDIRWVIGVDKDQYDQGIYEDDKSVILTSMMKAVDLAAYDVAERTLNGNFPGGENLVYTLENDGVGLPAENPNLSQDILDAVATAKQAIIDGDIEVPSTRDELAE